MGRWRAVLLTVCMCALVWTVGCARRESTAPPVPAKSSVSHVAVSAPASSTGEPSAAPLPSVPGLFADYDQPHLNPEPRGDSSGGTYLCRIVDVSSAHDGRVTVDLITDEWAPGTTKRDRERSSWPDYIGHNRYVHRQTLSLAGAVLAATQWGHDLHVVGLKVFADSWRADSYGRVENYYIRLRGHSVLALWPWTY
jgi:hypothetical protein